MPLVSIELPKQDWLDIVKSLRFHAMRWPKEHDEREIRLELAEKISEKVGLK